MARLPKNQFPATAPATASDNIYIDDAPPVATNELRIGNKLEHTGGWRVLTPVRYLSTASGTPKRAEIGDVLHDLAIEDARELHRRGVVEPELRG